MADCSYLIMEETLVKLIADIRIYNFSDSEKHIELDFRSSSRAVHRVAMKLRELKFSLGEFDHLYINFTTCAAKGSVALIDTVDQYHPWYRYCDVGVSMDEYERLESPEFIFEQIENVLLSLFCPDMQTEEIIRESIAEAKKGPEMQVACKQKKSAKYTATICLRLLDNGYYLPLLQVVDTNGNEVLCRDLPEVFDLGFLGEIQLNSKRITIKPRKNAFTKDLTPITVELPHSSDMK